MKKTVTLIACFFIAAQLFAQDCMQYMYMQKNKTIEMTATNNKGEVAFKSVTKVSDVNTTGGVTTANVVSEAYDKNGKLMSSSNVTYKCDGGVMMMDMNLNAPQASQQNTKMQMKMVNNGYMEYPSGMQVGDHLKDANTQMETTMNNGMTAVTTVQVTDRNVVSKESVTTTAGTWDCFKITYKTTSATTLKGSGPSADTINNAMSAMEKMRAKFGKLAPKMPSNTSETTMWYAPNFGMVKFQGKTFEMELTAIK